MRLAILAALLCLLALAGWQLATAHATYATQDRLLVSSSATRAHLAGTDELGRDRAVRLSLALILCLGGACAASAFSALCTVGLASAGAFAPEWLNTLLLYGGDVFLTLPWLFLLMLVRSALPLTLPPLLSGLVTFALLGVLGIPAFLRLHHGKTRQVARSDWMLQAHAAGLRPAHRWQAMLPHLRPLLLTQFLLYVPAALAAEANLGALGLGLSEPLPSMGTYIANLQSAALLAPSRLVYLPILLFILVLAALELSTFGVES